MAASVGSFVLLEMQLVDAHHRAVVESLEIWKMFFIQLRSKTIFKILFIGIELHIKHLSIQQCSKIVCLKN